MKEKQEDALVNINTIFIYDELHLARHRHSKGVCSANLEFWVGL